MAVRFARWLSVDFEIWCDEQIDALIRGNVPV
ncbi:KilA-N domain-containing protein [Providencia heimbachae]|nr:KilA-N domain-containing protein [Providencia heimbachae]